jgi:hypothetical protein
MSDSPLARRAWTNLQSVQAEIAQEKAASLGRMATRLQDALTRLAAFDTGGPGEPSVTRPALVDAAGQALWFYVVQREACGLRDVEAVLREYRVPREVYLRMGFFSTPRPHPDP